ncbi:MAG: LPS export ABC transporter permease LptF [Desulfobacteraceae bacterium]|jgi:lipopolysaccharide export system permease protein|nr:LPS export ABC transporter permease LptF [Desulfobacteraceae bacterium]
MRRNAFLNGKKLIIDRYIMREIVKPTVTICVVLIFIFGCYTATRYLADAVSGQLSGTTVFFFIVLKIAIALEVLLPTTLYLSVVIAFGRMYQDSEMTALSACGVSRARLLRPVFLVSLVIAVTVSCLSLYIRPWAYSQFFYLRAQAQANFDLTRMKGGTFYEIADGERVIFAEKVDQQQNKARRVFIRTERDDNLQVIYAQKARQHLEPATGKQIIVFTDGYLYEFSRQGEKGRIIQFEQSAMPLEANENIQPKYRIKAATTGSLAFSDDSEEIAELQWRLSTPLATILLALIGVPLSRSSPRQGKYAKIMVAVLIFAFYYNLSAIIKKWVEKGVLDTLPGIWWAQLLLAGLLLLLLWQPSGGFRWRWR